MMWRETLTPHELQAVNSAPRGSTLRKLADLLDQMESQAHIPGRPALSQFDRPGTYIPPNLIRLDE
jgi:hypothetical protein